MAIAEGLTSAIVARKSKAASRRAVALDGDFINFTYQLFVELAGEARLRAWFQAQKWTAARMFPGANGGVEWSPMLQHREERTGTEAEGTKPSRANARGIVHALTAKICRSARLLRAGTP